MSNTQNIAEHASDETSSLRAADALTTPMQASSAPVYRTRREAREAERAAAAAAVASVLPAVEPAAAAPALSATEPATTQPAAAEPATTQLAAAELATSQPAAVRPVVSAPVLPGLSISTPAEPAAALPTRASLRAAEASAGRARGPRRSTGAARPSGARPAASTAPTSSSRRPAAARTATPAAAPRSGASAFQRTSKRVTVVGAMLFASAMLVATSVPANAFFVDTPENTVAKKSAAAAQSFVAGGATDGDVSRDGYSVTEMKVASEYASTSSSTFSNDIDGTVQWPFQTGVPISSGFGARQVTNCGFCSTFHEGLDFVPGAGSPIQAIADGTVSVVSGPSGAFGNHVEIEHVIDGQKVTSTYSHMQTGSVQVRVGDTVTVGQLVGKVGSTGNSTGAHLHFEIHLSGVPVDPYPWLQANTN